MTENLIQPDFVLTVGGQDLTKFCKTWELHDVEDAVSSLNVTLVNPSMRLSGQIQTGQTLSLKWGYQNNVSSEVEMEIKDYSENYSKKGLLVIFKATDCMDRLNGSSYRGNAGKGVGSKRTLEAIGKDHDIKLELGNFKVSALPTDGRWSFHNETAMQAFNRHMDNHWPGESAKGDGSNLPANKNTGPSAGGDIKAQKIPGSGHGRPSTDGREKEDKDNNCCQAGLDNKAGAAASANIRGSVDIIGKTEIKAKMMITILNVGPQASGQWYVKGCNHTWDVKKGYHVRADLIRQETGKDGKKGKGASQPMVKYANIYKKDSMYCGPRKMDGESCGTYTFGTDDPEILEFKMSITIPEAKGQAKAQTERILVDNSEKTNEKGDGVPMKSGGFQQLPVQGGR